MAAVASAAVFATPEGGAAASAVSLSAVGEVSSVFCASASRLPFLISMVLDSLRQFPDFLLIERGTIRCRFVGDFAPRHPAAQRGRVNVQDRRCLFGPEHDRTLP